MHLDCYNLFISRRLGEASENRLSRLRRSTEEARSMRMHQQRDSLQERRVRTLLSAALAAFLVLGSQVAADAQALTDHPNSITSCSWTPATGTVEAGASIDSVSRFNGTVDGTDRVKFYVEVSGYFGTDARFDNVLPANANIDNTFDNFPPPETTEVGTLIFYSVTENTATGDEFKGVELCRLTLTFLPEGGGTDDDDEEPTQSPAQSPLALSCSPDPVVAGGVVTCVITGGDPGIDILWRASYNPAFASQGVRLDAEGNGSFSFVAPAAALGLPVTVELVEWDRTAVVTVGRLLPTRVPAGEGQGGLPLGVTLGGLLVLAGALRLRLRLGRAGAVS